MKSQMSFIGFLFAISVCLSAGVTDAADRDAEGEATTVNGRVYLEGSPLPAGRIAFHAADGQFYGSTLKDGKFQIDQARVGKFTITVEGKEVPDKYSSVESSKLMVEVLSGGNTIDFELIE